MMSLMQSVQHSRMQDMLDVTLEAAKKRAKSKALLSGTKTGKVSVYPRFKEFQHQYRLLCVFKERYVHRACFIVRDTVAKYPLCFKVVINWLHIPCHC